MALVPLTLLFVLLPFILEGKIDSLEGRVKKTLISLVLIVFASCASHQSILSVGMEKDAFFYWTGWNELGTPEQIYFDAKSGIEIFVPEPGRWNKSGQIVIFHNVTEEYDPLIAWERSVFGPNTSCPTGNCNYNGNGVVKSWYEESTLQQLALNGDEEAQFLLTILTLRAEEYEAKVQSYQARLMNREDAVAMVAQDEAYEEAAHQRSLRRKALAAQKAEYKQPGQPKSANTSSAEPDVSTDVQSIFELLISAYAAAWIESETGVSVYQPELSVETQKELEAAQARALKNELRVLQGEVSALKRREHMRWVRKMLKPATVGK